METSNIIITVGRQLGSGGREIATLLAQRLGYKMYDSELLNLAAKESGLCERLFERNDEQKAFSKSFFRYNLPLIGGEHGMFQNELSQDTLFKFQSEAIIKAAEANHCVFVGRCADYILRDAPHLLSLFVTANIEERIQRVMQRLQCDEKKAATIVREGDERRAAYYEFYTGKTWGLGSSYDLCVNSSVLGIADTADILCQFIEAKFSKPCDE